MSGPPHYNQCMGQGSHDVLDPIHITMKNAASLQHFFYIEKYLLEHLGKPQ